MSEVERKGFSPLVNGLDSGMEGGIPQGSWAIIFGNPGSYKTLHALAWMINALRNNEKVVYVSTEQSYSGLRTQVRSLGWEYNAEERHLSTRLLDSEEWGRLDLVWVDLTSLRFLAHHLNRLARETRESSEERSKYYWYYDPELLTYAIILALEGVGSIERREQEITLRQVKYLRIADGFYGYRSAMANVRRNVRVRIIIDSISSLFTARWSIAGRILTDMKVRLEAPVYTFLLTSQVSKTNEEELGAQIGHIVDGRIRLWNEMTRSGIARVTGWIAKMRLTDHSRVLHEVRITGSERKRIEWVPLARTSTQPSSQS